MPERRKTTTAGLIRWKREAMPLLKILDECHDILPVEHQAELGHSKAEAVRDYLRMVTVDE